MRSHSSVLALLPLGFLALFGQVAQADPLNFFNNWFVTGDYAVAGVALMNTGGAGAINMNGVPCTSGVGPSAAIVPCTTAGSKPAYPVAAFLYGETVENSGTATGANGVFDGNQIVGRVLGSDSSTGCWVAAPSQTLRVYRADVLRFLPIDPNSHLRAANGTYTVAFGNGVSSVLATEGASLVVIYRVVAPGKPLIVPLRSVVIYDGQSTLSKTNRSLIQNVSGFYQAAGLSGPQATMTHIVGNGQSSFNTVLRFNHANIGTHLFTGSVGPNWDNSTFNISLNTNDSSFTTEADAENNATCLSWAAIVSSTPVVDSDNDGLLDVWETGGIHRNTQVSPATFGACADYPTEPCVDLPAMGAMNGVQDMFLQVDWMHGFGDNTGGIDGTGNHSHIPKPDALSAVANAFAAHNVAVHFDVGNNYQGQGLPYIIPYKKDSYGNLLAQGGSDLDESTLRCSSGSCGYIEPYPVLSFKLGFNSVRDGNHLLNIPAHFAQNRKDAFHYVLFAHALAGPFDLTGKPTTKDPKSISGIGDRPGGDVMVTLGLWRSDIPANDQVGSALVQAGTLMHELGHNMDLSHGGWFTQPNCMPNYPSVMSYLYQTRGLTDANGVAHIDFSSGTLSPLNENALSATASMGPLHYRVRYYSPFNPLINSTGQAAKLHCDGTPITDGALEVRAETPTVATPDWFNGLYPLGTSSSLDVNFDGATGETFTDQSDWSSLNLQQIGSRTNFGSLSTGSLATDVGSLATDVGSLATDVGSLATDVGSLATDVGSLATDVGSLATDVGSLATDVGDEDYDTHIRSTTDQIPSPQQCAGCGLMATNGLSAITLSWTPPDTGGSLTYTIYRCAGAGCTPSVTPFLRNYVAASKTAPTFTDAVNDFIDAGATCPSTATCHNTTYTYSITAVSTAGIESPYSNTATSEVTHLFVVADNQTVVYGSPNPVATFKVYGDVAASLNNALVSCTYTGVPRNVGTYSITCTGPATTSSTDGVTYNAPYLTYTRGALTVTPRPITVTAAADTRIYDGTTGSSVLPAVTTGSLAPGDSATWTQTFDNRNVGTGKTLTPAGSVNDGNGGNNYTVAFVPSTTGSITVRPITVTAATDTKVYDGTTSSSKVPTITTGSLGAGDSATWMQTFDNRNAGTGKTLTPAGSVNDGNGGNDYAVTFVPNTTGVITRLPIVGSITANNRVYDGTTAATIATGVLTGAIPGDAVSLVGGAATFSDKNVGNGKTVTATGLSLSGGAANNYTVNSAATTTANITPAPLTITADNKSVGDDSPTPPLTVTYHTLLGGDTPASLAGTLVCKTTRTLQSPLGTYPITCSGQTSTNYTITYVPGTLTVIRN
jgi:hypothetical protein